jgi:hypothetical protein
MTKFLHLAVWNANGLSHHRDELQLFLHTHNLDAILISETHFTEKSNFRIPHYTTHHTNHPAGTARGGTAIIIKSSIPHHPLNPYNQSHLQATSITLKDTKGPLILSAVYLPPNHTILQEQLEDYFHSIGPRFIAAGDYNAKHTNWGSRIISPRGRVLLKTMHNNNLNSLSSGEPTHWPTDKTRLPDLIDFGVTKGIPPSFAVATSCLDLSSDHTPILITLSTQSISQILLPRIHNKKTDWDSFRHLVNSKLQLNVPLKTNSDIEAAIKFLNDTLQWAGWNSSPVYMATQQTIDCPLQIKEKLLHKRKLRRSWHRLRTPQSKRLLNTATRELKQLLAEHRNSNFQSFLLNLSPTPATNYSLWKAAKRAKHTITPSHPLRTPSGSWARTNSEKAQVFANYLTTVFQPHPSENSSADEASTTLQLDSPYQLEPPLPRFRKSEVLSVIKNLKPTTAPGYDLITGKVLQELPLLAIQFLTQILNASTLIGYFPTQWKVEKIILHLKPGKSPNDPSSYRPISLLPILSKVYEKLILRHLLPIIEHSGLIPNHQFGFRRRHSTIHQTHRIIHKINEALEAKQYCSAAFLDISQAFDKVWHPGLLHKLRQSLPLNYYLILKSYLQNRHFQ